MAPELKAKWVAALRSGKYKQGKGTLYKGGKHCCLGVLHRIAYPDRPIPAKKQSFTSAEEIGLGFGMFPTHHLANMNDGRNLEGGGKGKQYSFAEIADYIERKQIL